MRDRPEQATLLRRPASDWWSLRVVEVCCITRGCGNFGGDNFVGEFRFYGRWRICPLAKFRGVGSVVQDILDICKGGEI